VLRDVTCRKRYEAMVRHVEADEVVELDDDEAEEALLELGPRQTLRRGGVEGQARQKELVLFARFNGDHDVFPGYSWREYRSASYQRKNYGVLCQSAVEIQSAVGCPFDCAYCPYSAFLCVRVDVETLAQRTARLVGERPGQQLYKLNNRTDTLALEPEHGLAALLVEQFARSDQGYLMLYSKGTAVDHLLDLDHRGRTVASFTLNPEPVAELLERSAPSLAERLEAAAKLGRAGYPLRVRFSPIVPIVGWREAYRELVARLAQVAPPEMATLWTLSMVELDDLERVVPAEALDAEAWAAACEAAPRLRKNKGAPFPPELRAELYREVAHLFEQYSPRTRVALCLEAPDVWQDLADCLTPRQGGQFLCNCGPRAVPPLWR
jgi:spore photoproduct lyase